MLYYLVNYTTYATDPKKSHKSYPVYVSAAASGRAMTGYAHVPGKGWYRCKATLPTGYDIVSKTKDVPAGVLAAEMRQRGSRR